METFFLFEWYCPLRVACCCPPHTDAKKWPSPEKTCGEPESAQTCAADQETSAGWFQRLHRRFAVLGEQGLHQQIVDDHMGGVQRGERRGQRAEMEWLHAVPVHQARYLHAAIARQIFDQPAIAHVAVNHPGSVQRVALDDEGTGIQAEFQIKGALSPPLAFQIAARFPALLPRSC